MSAADYCFFFPITHVLNVFNTLLFQFFICLWRFRLAFFFDMNRLDGLWSAVSFFRILSLIKLGMLCSLLLDLIVVLFSNVERSKVFLHQLLSHDKLEGLLF